MPARIEVRDNSKLINEMVIQRRYLPAWFYYFGGLADKIEGVVTPIGKPQHGYIAISQMQFDETI
jgi:hypothetical protein